MTTATVRYKSFLFINPLSLIIQCTVFCRLKNFAPACPDAIILESAYYGIMNTEQQPPDRSDVLPLSPKEMMRQTVVLLANHEIITPTYVESWNLKEDATKWGILRFGPLGPAKFMVAQIRDPRLIIPEPLYRYSCLLYTSPSPRDGLL